MKTICIDARFWGIRHTGIGRYIENLIANLPDFPRTKVVLIVPRDLENEPKLASFEKYYTDFHPYALLSQTEMLLLLNQIKPDLTHFTHFSLPVFWTGKFVVTIHDLIKHYSSGMAVTTRSPLVYFPKYLGYQLAMWTALHRSAHIMVPSGYWQDILVNEHHVSPSNISVTYEGVSGNFSSEIPEFQHDLPKPYVIYTGNLYPHKNVETLIKAVEILGGRVHLAIVCARSVFENRLPKSHLVTYLGRVTDSDLVSLYKNSAAFVFPSLIEGFGLPGLEAMAAGTPVIAADASCLPEVYGDAALFFNPLDPVDLAQKIDSVLTDPTVARNLIKNGLLQIKKYSWAKMAKETWQIYQAELH